MLLLLLDVGLYVFHLLLTAFNVFGWISTRTRRLHRWCVVITAACWVTIGPVFYNTFGYCPLTDWHWRVKHLRGETDLPNSFIAYLFHQVGLYPDPVTVDIGVGVTFGVVILITFFLWLRERRHKLAV